MDTNINHKSKTVKLILSFLVIAILIIVIFEAGVLVGYHRAAFSFGLGDNYYRAFEAPHRGGGMVMPFGREDFPNAHGAVGKIVRINLPTFVVASSDNVEKTVTLGTTTIIRSMREEVSSTTLKTGDYVVVLGSPTSNAEIKADLVRVLPAPLSKTQAY